MAKYLDQAGITVLVGQITNSYDERYAALEHLHATNDVTSLSGYSATSVSGTTLTDADSLNAALKKLYNLSSSKLSTIPISTRSVRGGIKVGKHYTGAATFSPVATDPATAPTINSVSTTAGRYYAVETDSSGLAFVNVPWVDYNTTYAIATTTTAGLVKPFSVITKPTINSLSKTSGKYYHVEMSSDGNMFVNVPWTDTKNPGTVTSITLTQGVGITVSSSGAAITSSGTRTISLKQATSGELGGIKIGYTENGKNYPVELDSSGKAFVSVPWTNTTYTAAKYNVLGLLKPSRTYTGVATLKSPAVSLTTTPPTIAAISTTTGRYYAVESDAQGVPFVNVPWTNTTYTFTPSNPTLAWGDESTIGVIGGQTFKVSMPAIPTATEVGALPATGTAVAASKVTNSLILKIKSGTTEGTNQYTFNGSAAKTLDIKAGSNVSLTAAAGVLTIAATNTTYSVANQTTLGLIKPWMVHTAASTYNGGSTAPTSNATAVNVNALSTTSGRYYAVEMDNAGRAFVNVPWVDTKNAGTVTSITLTQGAGITVSSSGTAITTSGTRTISLKQATSNELGGIKIGYATAGKNYAVQLDEETGAAFVNVPWTDTKNPGTVTSITLTQGAGIIVSNSGKAITSSGTRTISLHTATNKVKGGFMPWMSHTAASTYNGGSTAPVANATTVNVNAISTTNGKYYAIETDSNGRAFVNVPWTDSNTNYYPTKFTWTNGTTAGPTGSLTGAGMSAVSFGAIPHATATTSGIVTTGPQVFSGTKTITALLEGGSKAITQGAGDDSTYVATTAFVHNAIANDITALSEAEIQSAVEAALTAL